MLYPIGIQDFEKIRKDGLIYVDKTEQIYKLFHGSGNYFFLSRPRRFGKSLLISTMEAYFCGRKDLFEGLAIAELEKDWKQYPVLRMDFSGRAYDSSEALQQVFDQTLRAWEEQYGVENKYTVPGIRFSQVIEAAHAKTGRPVVILVDITSGNVEMFMRRFTAFFADMDYRIQGDAELYFQNTMYVMLKLMGQQVQVERHTSNGRIDALIQTDKYVYILELKRDKDPRDALDQIAEKAYDWPFAADARTVFRIGATFSTASRRLEDWKLSRA